MRLKKQRGLKRYYRDLRGSIASIKVDVEPDQTSFIWYEHLDFSAKTNVPARHRWEHAKLLFSLFDAAEKQLQNCQHSYLISIDYEDTYPFQYAVKVVTGTAVDDRDTPRWTSAVDWHVPVPELVGPFIEPRLLVVGQFQNERHTSEYVIVKLADLP